jgi:hypothetical protein
MRHRGLTLAVASLFLVLVACSSETPPAEAPTDAAPAPEAAPAADRAAVDLLSGTWVLNLSKSKYNPAELAPKSNKVVLTAILGGVQVVTDGVDAQGRATHGEYTATFDGPDIPTNGSVDGKPNPDVDTAAWKKIDDHTYEVIGKRKGEIVNTNRFVIAADGKSRTSTITGKTAKGQAVNHTVVLDKQ